MEEKTVENLVAELMQLKVEDQKVFTANVIRVENKIILTGISATVPVVVQTLEFDEDGELIRARNDKGQYVADNPDTVENEAYKEEE